MTRDGHPGTGEVLASPPLFGAERVLRLITNLFTRSVEHLSEIRSILVNGSAGLYIEHDEGPLVFTCDVDAHGLIHHLWIQMNPEKLARRSPV